jgi:hypothetical protein
MKKIIFILLFSPYFGFTQNNYLQINTYFGLQPNNKELRYVSYNQKNIIPSNCEDFSQCPNKTPEELMQSLLSAKNYEWDKMNYDYEITKHKEYNKKTSADFFQLTKKLSFTLGEENYCFLKYLIVSDNKEMPMATLMKMNNGIWQVISSQENMTNLMLMFKYLSPIALDGIFLQKPIGITTFDDMVKSVYIDKTLLLTEALKIKPNKDYTENEEKIVFGLTNQTEIRDETVKADIIFLLNKQSLFKYVDNSYYSSKNDLLLNTLISKLNFNSETKIDPIFRFNFNYNNQNFIILKITKIINDIEKTEQLSTFVEKNNEWILYKDLSSDVLKNLNKIMMNSNISLLESLNMISPKENLDIVYKVRNSDAYIDIKKLSEL